MRNRARSGFEEIFHSQLFPYLEEGREKNGNAKDR